MQAALREERGTPIQELHGHGVSPDPVCVAKMPASCFRLTCGTCVRGQQLGYMPPFVVDNPCSGMPCFGYRSDPPLPMP